MKDFINANRESLVETLKALCTIPAPSHFENERAEYCKKWLEGVGAEGVYIDDALNVIYPIRCEGCDRITVFVAHTDTVSPTESRCPAWTTGHISAVPEWGTTRRASRFFFIPRGISPSTPQRHRAA